MEPKWKNLGELLKTKRKFNNLTRAELSFKVGKSVSTVVSWEQGYRRPKQPSLLALRNILGIPIRELQTAAGYTPEFDWYLAFADKPEGSYDFLDEASDEEKVELRKYLHFLHFQKLVMNSK